MLNTRSKKASWVADHIHGPIPLSALDMGLISTETYNRLHNILQNSTLHFAFPSNRTSRFIHSLGCAHLAGKMFLNAILNATTECRNRFFEAFRGNLLIIDKSGKEEAGRIKLASAKLKAEDPTDFSDPMYRSVVPHGLNKSEEYLYILLYQSVRFAALLHDIGHPPFSHVVEYALLEIRTWLDELKDPTPGQRKLLDQLKNPGAVFHEGLGNLLAEHILEELCDEVPVEKGKFRFDLIRMRYITTAILQKQPPFFEGIGMIISGDCDADRLDYVSRDSVLCGLRKAPIDMTRLMKSCQLFEEPSFMGKPITADHQFVITPSTRALGVFEEFFRRRFDLYKYAIYHHRVAKFDHLLQACVMELAQQYLTQNVGDLTTRPAAPDGRLRDDISGLWEILGEDRLAFVQDRVDAFIQWDDSWLISVLRRRYFEHPARKEPDKADPLFYKLEELVSNKKWYYSLFKRADTFADVEKAFLANMPEDFEWKFVADEETEDLTEEFKMAAAQADATPSDGFFLSTLFGLMRLYQKFGIAEDVLEATCRDMENGIVAEAFFSPKWIKPGLKEEFLIADSNGQLLRVGRVSRILHELREAGRFFPPFFVFVRLPSVGHIEEGNMKKIRAEFGKRLAQNLLDIAKTLYDAEQKGGATNV